MKGVGTSVNFILQKIWVISMIAKAEHRLKNSQYSEV